MNEEYLDGLTYEELDELRFEIMNDDIASPFINDISAAINRIQASAMDTEYKSPQLPAPIVRVLRLIGVGG